MSRHCVQPLSAISLESLQQEVNQALRNWLTPQATDNPFAALRLFQTLRRRGHTSHAAVGAILAEAVGVLHGLQQAGHAADGNGRDLTDGQLLEVHYRENVTLEQLEERLSLTMSGVTARLRKARKKLATVIYQLEVVARVEYRMAQLQRLETPTYHTLVGAESTQHRLRELLHKAGPPHIVVIKSMGGSGKSTHADRLLREMINEDVWDQVVWISAQQARLTIGGRLRELGRPLLTPDALLERLFDQFFPNEPRPASLSGESMLARLAARVKECPCCICIDAVEAAADVEALLPILERLINPSKVILTSRATIGGYTISPATFELPELDEQDAWLLLQEVARANHLPRVQELNQADFHPIYAIVGGNPLAITIIAGQIEQLGVRPLLDYLAAAGSSANADLFQFIYAHSWEFLDATARTVLLALVLAGPHGSEYALLSAITRLGKGELLESLHRLASLSLVQMRSQGNETLFGIHNLTRTFLRKQALQADATAPVDAVSGLPPFATFVVRAVTFATADAQHASSLLLARERDQALHILSSGLELAAQRPTAWPPVFALLLALSARLELLGCNAQWLPYLDQAITVAQELDDRAALAQLHLQRARLLQRLGHYLPAQGALETSAQLFTALGDTTNLATALTQQAHIHCVLRRHQAARTLLAQADSLLDESAPGREYLYYLEGLIALNDHDPSGAETWFRRSLDLCRRQGNQRLVAKQLGVVGTALYVQGELDQAHACYAEAGALSAAVQDTVHQAVMQVGIGVIWLQRRQPTLALAEFARAEPALAQAQELWHLAMLDTNWGIAARQLEDWPTAESRLRASAERWRYLGDTYREANSHYELGLLYAAQPSPHLARQSLHSALACLATNGSAPGPDPLQRKVMEQLNQLASA